MVRTLSLHEVAEGIGRVENVRPGEPELLLSLRRAGDMKSKYGRDRLLRRTISTINNSKKVSGEWASEANGVLNYREPPPLRLLRQVHSRKVYWTEELESAGENPDFVEGDGLLTSRGDELLGVTVADCMPIYLFPRDDEVFRKDQERREHQSSKSERDFASNSTHLFGIVHSGWKGTGIAADALERIETKTGIEAKRMVVVFGPSIRRCCYRVDESRAELYASSWGNEAVRVERLENYYLDILSANISLLRKKGVEDIRIVDACTAHNEDFGSFRREGAESFTHMLAMIGYFH